MTRFAKKMFVFRKNYLIPVVQIQNAKAINAVLLASAKLNLQEDAMDSMTVKLAAANSIVLLSL
jgi:hypothetical protein